MRTCWKLGLFLTTAALAACRGPAGPKGPEGPPGPEGEAGVGLDGADGTDGADGEDGADALVALVDVEPGDACPFGGQALVTGTDDDGDGALDDAEIEATTYLCSDVPPPPEDVYIYSNDDAALLAGRELITGSVFIDGSEVTDLSPLSTVTQVLGAVYVSNTSLTTLAGLENITFINGALSLSGNLALSDIGALASLASVAELYIQDNDALTTLAGLEQAAPIYSVTVADNDALTDLSALDDAAPGTAYFARLPLVTQLPALQGTRSITLETLPLLTSLQGPFTSSGYDYVTLTSLGITDFTGMEAAETIYALNIYDLRSATSFNGLRDGIMIENLNIGASLGLGNPVLDDFLVRATVTYWYFDSTVVVEADPDASEPNDVPEDAKPFIEGITGGFTLTEGDVDWHSITYDQYSHMRIKEDPALYNCFDYGDGAELSEDCPKGLAAIVPVRVSLHKRSADGTVTEVAALLPSVQPTVQSALTDFFSSCGPLVGLVPVDPGVEYLLKVESNEEVAAQVGVFLGNYALLDDVNSGGSGQISGFVTTPLTPLGRRGPAPVTRGTTVVEHEFLVGLPRLPSKVARVLLAQHDLELVRMATPTIALVKPVGAGPSTVKTLAASDALKLEGELQRLRRLGGLRFVEPNRVRFTHAVEPNDALYGEQWHYRQIGLEEAWETTVGDAGTVTAIVDSGLVTDHPDLQCGRIVEGFDFIELDEDPTDDAPSFSHGTHVLGTVGACTNDTNDDDPRSGVAGVTHAGRLQAVRVCDASGGCYEDAIVSGIEWASGGVVEDVANNPTPAKIINMSLGGPGLSAAFAEAINSATARGTIVVVAAGNSMDDAANYTPAGEENVITVGAVGPTGAIASYSNYGRTIEVMAPGGEGSGIPGEQSNDRDGVWSTSGGTLTGPSFHSLSGTSMASPHIAGVVALMHDVRPSLTLAQATTILAETATPIEGCDAERCGPGLVDAAAAVQMAAGTLPAILSAPSVVRAGDLAAAVFTVSNVGEAAATVSLTNGTRVSGSLAQASLGGGDDAVVTVAVDRSGLAPGRYTQALTVLGGSRPRSVLVEFDVRDATGKLPLPPVARAFLVVHEHLEQGDGIQSRDVALGSEVASSQRFTEDEGFVFERIVQGDYFVYVEADLDQDGRADAVSCGASAATPSECPRLSVDLFGDVTYDGEAVTGPLELTLVPADSLLPPVEEAPIETLPTH